jgi:arginine-tRNA-protein transferase
MADAKPIPLLINSPQAEYDAQRNVSPERPCPYLPNRLARSEVYWADRMSGALYETLLARGFRRSGRVVYRPRCRNCQECRQMRVLVNRFTASRSARRVLKHNEDVRVETGPAAPSAEKYALYVAYLAGRHDGSMSRSYEAFAEFLYDSPMRTMEFRYFLGERLIGVSVLDKCPKGLSSVYMYYDPSLRERSLGTFSILHEIEHCRAHRLPYYYLGYHVAGSKTMDYKSRFRPAEVLVAEGRWIALP